MHAEKISWIGEPSEPYNKKFKRWSQYTSWPFKLEGDDLEYIMGVHERETYLAEKVLIDSIDTQIFRGGIRFKDQKMELIKLIEAYGEKVADEARHDVHDEYASRDPSY